MRARDGRCSNAADGICVQLAASPHRDVIFQRMKDAPKPGRLLLLEGYRPERPIYNMDGPSQVENLHLAPMLPSFR